jgi:hypothetical protein
VYQGAQGVALTWTHEGGVGIGDSVTPARGNAAEVHGNLHLTGHQLFLHPDPTQQSAAIGWDHGTDSAYINGGGNLISICARAGTSALSRSHCRV